jgi:ATP-dependent helicase HepA
MILRKIHPGSFVWVSGALTPLGIGRVLECAQGQVQVEYFYSIARRCRETVPESQINIVPTLAAQTRCYVCSSDGSWQMGRIGRLFEGEYEVFFRQGEARFLSPAAIFVRCMTPIEDPTETLVYKAHETPFFHDRRFRFVRSLISQRAAARGMTGLLSSRICLYPHQVEVVRRVLEDPVQRYLLADEVGLGKTIEAGVVLRQYLLDATDGRAVVLVPPLLVDQWAEELESKFQISRFDASRVLILPTDAVDEALRAGRFGIAIIDEAQHVATGASSAVEADRKRYATYQVLCRSVDRLLLLSATPVLNNEQDFLAMLHLLDPQVYRIEDLAAFQSRVRNRQEVGHVLLSLQEGSPAYVIEPSVERLRTLFPADTLLKDLTNELERSVRAGTDNDDVDRAIRSVRIHVSETYRLHRRMLRNRRAGIEGAILLGRAASGSSRTPRILEPDLDERSPQVHALLEDWRDAAAVALQSAENASSAVLDESGFVRVLAILVQAAGTWLELLNVAIRVRLGHSVTSVLSTDFSPDDLSTLRDVPPFQGERELLEELLAVLRIPSEEGDRLSLLKQSLRLAHKVNRGGPPPKCVVFTSYTGVCQELLRQLRGTFGEQAVVGYHRGLSRQEVEQGLLRFRKHPDCFVLLCDRCGEEGRNLQFADRVIHFDVPLSPNRMEQRIGRLDRIGRDRPVRSTIFIGPECEGSLFAAWYAVLDEGFKVFDRSIASLQFFVDECLNRLLTKMFREGGTGLRADIPAVQAGCALEQERIDEQDALDAIDALEQNAVSCFETIQQLENSHADLEKDLHGWVGEALGFRRDKDFHRTERTTLYGPDFDRYKELRTLVPSDWLQHRLSRHLQCPGAFDRAVALRVEGTPILRIGEGFVDEMASYLRWDDRGQAFALWRYEQAWDTTEGAEWIGFRFNYVVSADTREARRTLKEQGLPPSAGRSLERRADAFLPPFVETVFLDTDCRPATDANLLAVLNRPYLASNKGGSDYNLANERLEALDTLIPPSRWADICTRAREASALEVLKRGTPALQERCEAFAHQADHTLAARLTQLRLRSSTESAQELIAEEAVGAALVRGIRSPLLRLDSVGFIAVSGRRLQIADSEDER